MKYIPYEKLSKAKKRELDRKKRNTWNNVKPVTRVHKSAKEYSRKNKNEFDAYPDYWYASNRFFWTLSFETTSFTANSGARIFTVGPNATILSMIDS